MKEKLNIENSKEELGTDRDALMEHKKEYLESIKATVQELFGTESLPKELVKQMVDIRVDIRDDIGKEEYQESLEDVDIQKIQTLFANIIYYKQEKAEFVEIVDDEENEGQNIFFADGTQEKLDTADEEFLESLTNYFDAYRMTYNAAKFNNNVNNIQRDIVLENKERKINFYSEESKLEVVVHRLFEKYEKAGFTKEEIKNVVQLFDLEKIDELEVHKIRVTQQIVDIFSKFMKGDKSKFVGLSTALLVPAYINGVTPMFLADAFQKGGVDKVQVAMYALLSGTSIASSTVIEKYFKDFLDTNFQKEDGYAEHITKGIAELPGEEIEGIGFEQIKERTANAKSSYEQILRSLSFNVLPASVTLGTSAYMLYEKSPILAAGTVAGTGIMMAMNKYVHKKGKFWEKEQEARQRAEEMSQKVQELLSAHMEIILSGEKDKFIEEMDAMLSKERVAMSDRRFLSVIRNKVMQSYSVLNFIAASIATTIAGGSADNFIAALVYSGNFNDGVSDILESTHELLRSSRDMMELEVLFNGYAEEEKEKESQRVGMSELDNYDIILDNVGVGFRDKTILKDIKLKIQSGDMVQLQGASGAGKTTLMKIIAGYYKPTEGNITMGDTDLGDIKKSGSDSIYSKIAYLSQYPYILEGSVRDNLKFGTSAEVSDVDIKSVLKEVGLDERLHDFNEMLSGGRGDSASLSGGEASRLGLARTILKMRKDNPKIVFFDEPTASVDEKMSQKIAEIINQEKQQNSDTTFIVISHDKVFTDSIKEDLFVQMKDGEIATK
jgi:ABC-type multidrug transport system fused ATPase/permease subunit